LPQKYSTKKETDKDGLKKLEIGGDMINGFSPSKPGDHSPRCSSPVKKKESFRIATELNRIDSLTMQESLKKRQRLRQKVSNPEKHDSVSKDSCRHDHSTKDNSASNTLDDGYVNVVFRNQGFPVVSQPGQPIYSNVQTPTCSRLDQCGNENSEGDYIELPTAGRPLSECCTQVTENSVVLKSNPKTSALSDRSVKSEGCMLAPFITFSHTSTPSSPDRQRSRMMSDPGICIKSQFENVLENIGSKLYGSMLLSPTHAIRRHSAEDSDDGQSYSHGASTFYLESPLHSPNRSTSELREDISDDFNTSGNLNLEDPWIPRQNAPRKAATLGGFASKGLDGVNKYCPLRRSSSFSMGESVEDLRTQRGRRHRRQPSDTLVFINRNAYLASPRNIVPDLETERTLARLATPPRELCTSDICKQIQLSKEHGRVVARYATPPRTVDNPVSHNTNNVAENKSHTCLDHREASDSRPSMAFSEDSNYDSDLWGELEKYMYTPASRIPQSSRLQRDCDLRPDSMCSMTSSVASSNMSGACMSSPESSIVQSPAMSPSSPVSTDSMIDSLKQAVHNLTARITRRGPRSLDASPCRSPASKHRNNNSVYCRQDSDASSERTNSPEPVRVRFSSKESSGRKDKRRHFVYQLARAYSNRIKRANIVDKRGKDGPTTAKQLASLLKDNKPGSPSIGARMATSRPIVLGTYTLPRHRIYRSRKNRASVKENSSAASSSVSEKNNGAESSESAACDAFSENKDTLRDDTHSNDISEYVTIVGRGGHDSASAEMEEYSSADSVDDNSLYYYENKFAADLEAGLDDEAFRDSAVYSDDGLLGPEDYPGLKVSIRDTVRLIEQRYRAKPIPKIEVKQMEKATGIKEIMKTLETTPPSSTHTCDQGDRLKSVRDRTRELLECATLTRIRQTSLSLGGAEADDMVDSRNLSTVKKGWVKEVVKQLEHDTT
jgi:hypothetical protein